MNPYMKAALEEARLSMEQDHGGPFGCVLVRQGQIVGKGHHALRSDGKTFFPGEWEAILAARENLGAYELSGCELFTVCEPGHLCLCLCLQSGVEKIHYGATLKDQESVGFSDERFSVFSGREKLGDYLACLDRDECMNLLDEYRLMAWMA